MCQLCVLEYLTPGKKSFWGGKDAEKLSSRFTTMGPHILVHTSLCSQSAQQDLNEPFFGML